ncbi:flagellar hook-length control protein FliK [Parvularcula oceani]|uniref:flagellar hook-length control protein FliK n=1 Tax=Parvularcula oceani TaxID=1247963 RepID=UPI0004E18000|nr:flagellar hook-length control protein FliK [Parvularcula oceani]
MIPLPLASQTRTADPVQTRGEVQPERQAPPSDKGGAGASLRTGTDAAEFLLAVETRKTEGALPESGEAPSPHVTVETLSPQDGPVLRLTLGEQPRDGLLPVPTAQPAPAHSAAGSADPAASEGGLKDIMAPSRGAARAPLAAGERFAAPAAQAPAAGSDPTGEGRLGAEAAPAKPEAAASGHPRAAASTRMQAAGEAAAPAPSAPARTASAEGAATPSPSLPAGISGERPSPAAPGAVRADPAPAAAAAPLPGADRTDAHPRMAELTAVQAEKTPMIRAADRPAAARTEIAASSGQPLTGGPAPSAAPSQAPTQAPGPAVQLAPPAPGEAARQVADAIAMRSGERTMTLRLDPPDLGVVRVEFSFERHGVTALLSAENADTGSLLKRHTEWLQKELANSFGEASVSFGSDDAKAQKGAAEERWRTLVLDRAAEAAGPARLPAASQSTSPLGLTGRIDIRL